MKKWLPYILIALLALAVFFLRKCGFDKKADPATNSDQTVNRERGFDRRISYLRYSYHAKCRMQCRQISQLEVEDIMKGGKINYRKSDLKDAKCPRYAIEGNTNDGQHVRIVFAQCNDSTVVVTAIDLETSYHCDCPGDDNKYINRN